VSLGAAPFDPLLLPHAATANAATALTITKLRFATRILLVVLENGR